MSSSGCPSMMMMMMCAISSIEVLHSSAGKRYGLLVPGVDLPCTCHQEYDPAEGHEDSHARECSYSVLPETCSDSFLPPILSR